MPIELIPWDTADFLTDAETQQEYLTISLEEYDAKEFTRALGQVARAQGGISALALKSGIAEERLAELILGRGSNPDLATVLAIMQSLGFRLTASIVGMSEQMACIEGQSISASKRDSASASAKSK